MDTSGRFVRTRTAQRRIRETQDVKTTSPADNTFFFMMRPYDIRKARSMRLYIRQIFPSTAKGLAIRSGQAPCRVSRIWKGEIHRGVYPERLNTRFFGFASE